MRCAILIISVLCAACSPFKSVDDSLHCFGGKLYLKKKNAFISAGLYKNNTCVPVERGEK